MQIYQISKVNLQRSWLNWIELFFGCRNPRKKERPSFAEAQKSDKMFWMSRAAARTGSDTDAHSFHNSFEGVLGVVRKFREGTLFSWLLHLNDQFFPSLLRGYMRCPLPPLSPLVHLWVLITFTGEKNANIWGQKILWVWVLTFFFFANLQTPAKWFQNTKFKVRVFIILIKKFPWKDK